MIKCFFKQKNRIFALEKAGADHWPPNRYIFHKIQGLETKVKIDILFETSWEVCNKVGGIYTVLSTRAHTLQRMYKDKVVFIGPDVWKNGSESPDFIEDAGVLRFWKSRESLPYGLKVRTGRWDVPGKPIIVLVDFEPMYALKDEFYGEMWRDFGVDSLHAYGDYDEACAFSHAVGVVMESIFNDAPSSRRKNVLAHFNEWTTGMGLLYVKSHMPQVGTLFTTHATCIGRSICGNGKPLYDYLPGYYGDQMSRELNMESKHSLEKAAAHNADCFTTVSDVTAAECEQLLEKRPDVVTPNGFENNFVPSPSKLKAVAKNARKRLTDIAEALTGKTFGDDTMIIATSGRCEFRNKGIDLFLDMLATMEYSMGCDDRNVLAFVLVPAWSRGAREDLKARLSSGEKGHSVAAPVITHELNNPGEDVILNRIRSFGMSHMNDSKVHVIYVPCYLDGKDGIVDLPYYDVLPGLDATVFASYYEPWGYTPLESVAFGVPTVTTSLSGFGQWVASTHAGESLCETGVEVVKRTDSNYSHVVSEIMGTLRRISAFDDKEKAAVSAAAMSTAEHAAWNYFIDYYVKSYGIALEAAHERARANSTNE